MAVAYLLLVVAGATGALSVLIWLFEEDMPEANRRIERETFGGVQSADHFGSGHTSSASAETEGWEDEAA
jgi:hypothetical protein